MLSRHSIIVEFINSVGHYSWLTLCHVQGLEDSVVSKTDMILAPAELKDCGGDRGQSVGRSVRRVNLMGLQEGRESFP